MEAYGIFHNHWKLKGFQNVLELQIEFCNDLNREYMFPFSNYQLNLAFQLGQTMALRVTENNFELQDLEHVSGDEDYWTLHHN